VSASAGVLKLVIDESVGHPIIERLRHEGYDIQAIEDAAPGADDTIVLDIATRSGGILMTEDKDFGDLIYQRHLPLGAGVILLRLEGMPTADKCDHIAAVMHSRGAEMTGAFTVISTKLVRIRPWP
jgi:predicted nuclease of predicted toxin-antitoxin system